MDALSFLLSAFLGGFLVFITEELLGSAKYSIPTILVCFLMGLIVFRLTRHNLGALSAWMLVGGLVAALTAIVRVGIVFGGYVSFLAGVDCFAMQGLTNVTYILFALSGMVAGAVTSRFDKGKSGSSAVCAVGIISIILGVLYHLKISQGWWSGQVGVSEALLLGEFLAPAIIALVLLSIARRLTIATDS